MHVCFLTTITAYTTVVHNGVEMRACKKGGEEVLALVGWVSSRPVARCYKRGGLCTCLFCTEAAEEWVCMWDNRHAVTSSKPQLINIALAKQNLGLAAGYTKRVLLWSLLKT